jgi:hypothetical protein
VHQHRLTRTVTIRVRADHWKTILPDHRLQVHDSSKRALVLEMQEPVLAGLRFNPGALVRDIDSGFASRRSDAIPSGFSDSGLK